MKYRYAVKWNGEYYPAGTEVPTGEVETKSVETTVKEVKTEVEVPVEKPAAKQTAPEHSKTDINRMSTDKLKALAKRIGIKVTDESTGKQLKEAIIEHYGL